MGRAVAHKHEWYTLTTYMDGTPGLYACSVRPCIATLTRNEWLREFDPEEWDRIRPRCGAEQKNGKPCENGVPIEGWRCARHRKVKHEQVAA